MCSQEDDPSMIDKPRLINGIYRLVESLDEKPEFDIIPLEDDLPQWEQKDTDNLMKTIPYSDCGQAMFTVERLIAHNKECNYCRPRQI